jgi:hypothetical protein
LLIGGPVINSRGVGPSFDRRVWWRAPLCANPDRISDVGASRSSGFRELRNGSGGFGALGHDSGDYGVTTRIFFRPDQRVGVVSLRNSHVNQ